MGTTTKNYVGPDQAIKDAIFELEDWIGDMDSAELTDGGVIDCEDAVVALNVLIDALNDR